MSIDIYQTETMASYIMCIVLITCGTASGLFDSTPEKISPGTTKSVLLRCDPDVKNAAVVLAINIKKKDSDAGSKPPPSEAVTPTGEVGKTEETRPNQEDADTTTTTTTTPAPLGFPRLDRLQKNSRKRRDSDDDQFVRAMITATNDTDIVPRGDRFQVSGNIKAPPYLSVTIINPGGKDIGLFECEVTILDHNGALKTSSELTQIREVVEMTVQDLEQRVKQLEDDRQSNTVSIQEMKKVVDSCVEANRFVQGDVAALQKKTDDVVKTMTELNKEVSSISARLSRGGDDQKGQGHGNQYVPGDPRSDELFRLNARIDELMTNQILAMAKKLKELRDYVSNTQERVMSLENLFNTHLDKRLRALEGFEWTGIKESLQAIELRTIPLLLMNVTEANKNITDLYSRITTCCGDAPAEETSLPSSSSSSSLSSQALPSTQTTAATEELITNYTVPACFVCGNNVTEEKCPVTHKNRTSACPPNEPFCITDLYQDGMARHIYKRCATEKECTRDTAKSSAECSTYDFMKPAVIECHFCCTSILCNSDIRPPKDLY